MAKSDLIIAKAKNRTYNDLKRLQALPLEQKIALTERRVQQFYDHYWGQVFLSFSGGLGSTVLKHIINNMELDVISVFSDTGLEYPEIKEFALNNVDRTGRKPDVVKPRYTFRQVIDKWGFAFPTKTTAMALSRYRSAEKRFNEAEEGSAKKEQANDVMQYRKFGRVNKQTGKKEKAGTIPLKHHDLLDSKFKFSEYCCTALKKHPLTKYANKHKKHPITGEQASESDERRKDWLKHGCNAFNKKKPKSTPLSFWTEQDVLGYIFTRKIPYCKEIYGAIVIKNDLYETTGAQRTGCMWCLFGIEMETKSRNGANRFTDMYYSHPNIWFHCIHMLGFKELLDFKNIPYDPTKHLKRF